MATIGKSSDDKNVKKSIAQLEAEFGQARNEVAALLKANPDRKSMDESVKSRLRQLYLRGAELARRLADQLADKELSDKYNDRYRNLSAAAAELGSTIRTQIPTTTFDDVKGLEDVKALVKTFVYLANNPSLISHYRIDGGLGLLLYGPPGTGKTMFAEAIANEMQLPLFVITPADIFKSYVGESEQAVKAIFDELEACSEGAILFVDECESIFSRRTSETKDYKAAVTTELLQRINGFGVDGSKRIMVAATNRPDQIDPAYLRFKRFSHLIYIPLPDEVAKRAIIAKRLSGIELEDGLSVDVILNMIASTGLRRDPPLYSAADVCAVTEKACFSAILQMQQNGQSVPIPLTRQMFVDAIAAVSPQLSQSDLRMYEEFAAKGKN